MLMITQSGWRHRLANICLYAAAALTMSLVGLGVCSYLKTLAGLHWGVK